MQRAEAQPGQHLSDQDGAQYHVVGDIAHPVQELAREVARLARRHAVGRGRRLDGQGRQEHDHERKRVEHERPHHAQAEDERGSHHLPDAFQLHFSSPILAHHSGSWHKVHGGRTDEARDKEVERMLVEFLRHAKLLDESATQRRHAQVLTTNVSSLN